MVQSKVLVLVVDDAADNRDIIACCLERQGYAVEESCNGREALERMGRGPSLNLVLLDLMMPVMSGWAFLDEKALNHAFDNIPVVVLSACDELSVSLKGRAVAGFLQKPFSIHAMIDAVARHHSR